MSTEILLTTLLVIATIVTLKSLNFFFNKIGKFKRVSEKRVYYINKTFSLLIIIISFLFLAFIWSVNLSGLLIFASSIFAVIGVALFAQWSILSNVTSSIIIFFTFPSRVGDKVQVVDGENSVSGEIVEISLFQIEIKDEDGNTVFYPNNLFMQKPIKKFKK
ncbi:MAG: mechanosensitive ion channel [Campylobacterales bacterium]|nr:mechanosensitive ion channel [Campylobacterales bacterium]